MLILLKPFCQCCPCAKLSCECWVLDDVCWVDKCCFVETMWTVEWCVMWCDVLLRMMLREEIAMSCWLETHTTDHQWVLMTWGDWSRTRWSYRDDWRRYRLSWVTLSATTPTSTVQLTLHLPTQTDRHAGLGCSWLLVVDWFWVLMLSAVLSYQAICQIPWGQQWCVVWLCCSVYRRCVCGLSISQQRSPALHRLYMLLWRRPAVVCRASN